MCITYLPAGYWMGFITALVLVMVLGTLWWGWRTRGQSLPQVKRPRNVLMKAGHFPRRPYRMFL
jgi:protein-S-isoprenylcysteine O-methyltransferase Ste14